MHILVLSSWYPYPPDSGSRIRVTSLLRALSQVGYVALIAFKGEADAEWLDHRAWCDELYAVPTSALQPTRVKNLVALVSPQPRSVVTAFSRAMQETIDRLLDARHWDLIVASELGVAPYAATIQGIPKILDDIEIGVFADRLHHTRGRTRLRHQLTYWKLRQYLKQQLPHFNAWTVVSQVEIDHLKAMGIEMAGGAVIPNGVDYQLYRNVRVPPEPDSLVFSGTLSYHANLDALAYLIEDILPLIKVQMPTVQLYVTGRTEGISLDEYAHSDHVHFTGYLPDVRPRVAASTVAVVPIREGSGTRVKILEALALGTPVVATHKGAEGLQVEHGQSIMLADSEGEFAHDVVALLRDPELRARLSDNGRALIESTYDWNKIRPQWIELVQRVMAKPVRPRGD